MVIASFEFQEFFFTFSTQKDLRSSVLKIANILEYKLSDDQVDAIVAKSTFKAMKTDPMVNPDSCNPSYQDGVKQNKSFMRKGLLPFFSC